MHQQAERGESRQNVRVFVALVDLRSAHNVGAVFRTADGAGTAGIFLVGTAPAPIDRFGRAQPDIAKTALGAEKTVPWTYHETVEVFLEAVQKEGLQMVVVEQDSRAVEYKTFSPTRDTVLVFGNEVDGVSAEMRDVAEHIIEIPMRGQKESLNVSVAAGVVLFRLLEGWRSV